MTHSACTRRNYDANIVSTTQKEAEDKIKTAELLYESIPDELESHGLRPVKYKNAAEELAFHFPPNTSSIVSKPGTSAIRGGKKDMYYDEAAHIKEFPKLWQAGLPAISRGSGKVTVISTPLGQSGLFYNLWNEPKFSHHLIPWWECRFFVRGAEGSSDPYAVVAEAVELAPTMTTEERINRFANDKILDIFLTGLSGNVAVFRTEYECEFVDETDAYFPYELIKDGEDTTLRVYKYYPQGYEPKGEISIGVDLAKERDQSVFTVVEHIGDKKYVRFIYATQDQYEEQFRTLTNLVVESKARRVSIDATGPGNMFFELAKNKGLGLPGINVEGVVFNQSIKEKWATQFKGDLQTQTVRFPPIKVLEDQIHGIKRTKTENGMYKFTGKADDYFWSLQLALYGQGSRPVRFTRL